MQDADAYRAAANRAFGQPHPARIALADAGGMNPDEEAKHRYIAGLIDQPIETVRADPLRARLDAFHRGLDRDFPILEQKAPRTARWLSNSSNAAIAHDDVSTLARIEGAFWGMVSGGPVGAIRGWSKLYRPQESLETMKAVARPVRDTAAVGVDLLRSGYTGIDSPTTRDFKRDVTLRKSGSALLSGGEGIFESLGGNLRWAGDALGGDNFLTRFGDERRRFWGDRARGHMPDAKSDVAKGFYSGIASLPAGVSALLITRGFGAVAGAGTLGAQTFGTSYGDARDQGASYGRATLKAGIDAAAEVLTEFGPQKFLGESLYSTGTMRDFVVGFLKREAAGEQLATLTQDFNQWVMLDANADKSFDDYLGEIVPHAIQTLVATATTTGAMSAPFAMIRGIDRATGHAAKRQAEVAQAQAARDALAEINQLAAASKLRGRAGGGFRAFMEAVTEDGPVTDIYAAPARLSELLEVPACLLGRHRSCHC